jgi:putative ABC transport system substrate-binding protein
MLTRRAFLAVSAGLLAAPVATAGQQVKMLPRLGILSFHSASDPPAGIDAFVQGLRARG